MSTKTGIAYAIKVLFNSEYNEDNIKLDDEQKASLSKTDSMMEKASTALVTNDKKSSKKGGFGKVSPIKDANTEKAMRAMYKEVKENSVEDRERE